MSAQQRVIGVDLGGTKILAGVVRRDGTIERQRQWPTPDSQEELVAALDAAVEDMLDGDVAALGFGVPSPIDQRTGVVLGAVNAPLRDFPLRDRMRERFGVPVGIDNDANAAAYAEWAFGAGRGTRTMVILTLGTGVGGGLVLDERPFRGWAEFGHMVIVHDGRPCQGACTGRGHLEAYCTGLAAGERARDVFGPDADSYLLVKLAREGDPRALELLDEIARHLGSGLGTLVNIFAPELAVIGGGFGEAAFDFLAARAREVMLREALSPADEQVEIVSAQLGTDAGLVGAALLAFEALE